LKFETKNKQQLLDNLKTGQGNFANEYIHHTPAYIKSKTPILRNNSLVSAAFSSGIEQAPKELPYDTLTEQGLAERDDADEALFSRLQQTRARMNDKLDESEYQADNNENVQKQIQENIKRGNAASKLQAIRKGSKERQEYEKIKETKNKAAEKIQKFTKTRLSVKKATLEETPEPSSSKKGKDDGDSEETDLGDDPENQKLFLASIQNYGVKNEDLDKLVFKGGGNYRKTQYPLLQQIAKELFQQNNSKEFLNQISDQITGRKHRIKSVSELNKALENLKKK
jgi:hypothetical protein